MNIKEIDLTNKVVLDLDKYIELKEELALLRMEKVNKEDKYNNLIKYLISSCSIEEYSNGKKYLKYDNYHNHLGDYIKEIEPDLYLLKLENDELVD